MNKIKTIFIILIMFYPFTVYSEELKLVRHKVEKTTDSKWEIDHFIEARYGKRTRSQSYNDNTSLAEILFSNDFKYTTDKVEFNVIADLIYDDIMWYEKIDWEDNTGWFNLRKANAKFAITDNIEATIGKQSLRWGLADSITVNDMFPKDWTSFFLGRAAGYSKVDAYATRFLFNNDIVDLDFVYMPRGNPSSFPDGRRLSSFSPVLGRTIGEADPLPLETRNRWFTEDQIALKATKNIKGSELSLYYFDGYEPTPKAVKANGDFYFPEMSVYGASLKVPVYDGTFTSEYAYRESGEDENGDKSNIKNTEVRYLIGYKKEFPKDFVIGIQYYIEKMKNYGNYLDNLSSEAFKRKKDKNEEIWTLRLTKELMDKKLKLYLFNYYSPTNEDGYLRTRVTYKFRDDIEFELGGNLFWGKDSHLSTGDYPTTFFARWEENSNVFTSIRYYF